MRSTSAPSALGVTCRSTTRTWRPVPGGKIPLCPLVRRCRAAASIRCSRWCSQPPRSSTSSRSLHCNHVQRRPSWPSSARYISCLSSELFARGGRRHGSARSNLRRSERSVLKFQPRSRQFQIPKDRDFLTNYGDVNAPEEEQFLTSSVGCPGRLISVGSPHLGFWTSPGCNTPGFVMEH